MHTHKHKSKAYSLLELVVATFLLGLSLVPAMSFMTEAIATGRELETWNSMNLLAVGKLEEQLAISAADFTEGTSNGSYASLSMPSLRFTTARSWQTADGGIDDSLMVITVTVWEDADSDTTLDSEERRVVFATKVSKMSTYIDDAA